MTRWFVQIRQTFHSGAHGLESFVERPVPIADFGVIDELNRVSANSSPRLTSKPHIFHL